MTQQKQIRKQRDADCLFRLASERYLNSEYEEAMAYLQDAILISPEFSSAFCLMGHCNEKQGLDEDAIEQYAQAIVADPYHAEAWYCKGEVLNRLGRTKEGEEHIGKAVALSFGR